jgi:hypothetical protein
VPETRPNPEVVKAARMAFWSNGLPGDMQSAIRAAEPLIRQQLLDELLSDEVVEASLRASDLPIVQDELREHLREALQAAIEKIKGGADA